MNFEERYTRSIVSEVASVSLLALCMNDLLESKVLALQIETDVNGRIRDQADYDLLRTHMRIDRDTKSS